jgi:hypothetical protein
VWLGGGAFAKWLESECNYGISKRNWPRKERRLAKKNLHDERREKGLAGLVEAGIAIDAPTIASIAALEDAIGKSPEADIAVVFLLGRIAAHESVEVIRGTVPDVVDVQEGPISYGVDVRHGYGAGEQLVDANNGCFAGEATRDLPCEAALTAKRRAVDDDEVGAGHQT